MMEASSSGGREASRSFNPARLTLARERAGLTKQGLAENCGVTRRAVTSWEVGEVDSPPADILARVLGFPESFFYADDPVRLREEGVTFRALSSMQARQVGRVLAAASLAIEFSTWMDEHYKTPVPDLPDLSESHALEPPIAAESVRTIWGIHEMPVKDMLLLAEKKGVRVFSLPIADREVDALALWREDRPFVFLNTARSAERMRFDLAHELGHLVLHRQVTQRSREIEQQANDFAASFLMPADAVYMQVVGDLRFDDIFTLKRYWNVSAVAMLHRLSSLSIISEWHYRTWMIELSKRGYRTSEPGGSHPESSRLFRQLFALARQDGWSVARIASALSMPKKEIDGMVFGLALTSALPEAPPATLFDDVPYSPLHDSILRQIPMLK